MLIRCPTVLPWESKGAASYAKKILKDSWLGFSNPPKGIWALEISGSGASKPLLFLPQVIAVFPVVLQLVNRSVASSKLLLITGLGSPQLARESLGAELEVNAARACATSSSLLPISVFNTITNKGNQPAREIPDD